MKLKAYRVRAAQQGVLSKMSRSIRAPFIEPRFERIVNFITTKTLTETYYFLDCKADARMQLNDEMVPVKPGDCIMIRPGTRHRAIGEMTVLIIVFPKIQSRRRMVRLTSKT